MTLPIKPIFLLADSQLLFHSDETGRFLDRIREEIEAESPKAAYIGASNGDNPEYFSIFEAAMDMIGIEDRRMIYADYQEEDEKYLKSADLILLAGGDVEMGWKVIEETDMKQDIIQRYYGGAVLMGVSAGAIQLSLKGWSHDPRNEDDIFPTFQLIPFLLDAHDEKQQWERLKAMLKLGESYHRAVGISTGGGLVYHVDHTVEPVRYPLVEFSMENDDVVQNLLFPPGDKEEEPEPA